MLFVDADDVALEAQLKDMHFSARHRYVDLQNQSAALSGGRLVILSCWPCIFWILGSEGAGGGAVGGFKTELSLHFKYRIPVQLSLC